MDHDRTREDGAPTPLAEEDASNVVGGISDPTLPDYDPGDRCRAKRCTCNDSGSGCTCSGHQHQ